MTGSSVSERSSQMSNERGSVFAKQAPPTGNDQKSAAGKSTGLLAAKAAAEPPEAAQKSSPPKAPVVETDADAWLLADRYTYLSIDRAFKANLARLTMGLSPAVLGAQTFDWLAHLAISPGKQLQLVEKWGRKVSRLAMYAGQSCVDPSTPPCIAPLPQDRRFRAEAWQQWPYNLIYQSFLLPSNGGTTRRLRLTACRAVTRTASPSRCASFSTRRRRRTSSGRIPRWRRRL